MAGDDKRRTDKAGVPEPPVARQDPDDWMGIAGERLSQVRYVFIVQIEDGIASAHSRAALEYSDAVLMGWPDSDAKGLHQPTPEELQGARAHGRSVERHLLAFRAAEKADDTNEVANQLVAITESIAKIRKIYQPGLELPDFDEINRVVRDEWEEDMDRIGEVTARSADQLRDSIQERTEREPEGESDAERARESAVQAHDIPDPEGRKAGWDAFAHGGKRPEGSDGQASGTGTSAPTPASGTSEERSADGRSSASGGNSDERN